MNKALTLMELVVAISLVGVIILGAASFDIGSRQMFKSSEGKTQVINEAALILDQIAKDALTGIGDIAHPAITITGSVFNITHDDGDGVWEGTDPIISYTFNSGAHTLTRSIGGGTAETLSNKVMNFVPSLPGDNTADITVTLRRHPTLAVDTFSNPEVTMQSNVEVPAWSVN